MLNFFHSFGGELVMTCWHCSKDLEFTFQATDSVKFYHCSDCDKWYELSKQKERLNGAVPVRFFELNSRPQMDAAIQL